MTCAWNRIRLTTAHLQCTDHALSLKVQSLKGILVGLCGLTTRLSTSLNALISLIAIIEMTHDSGSRSASQDALSLRLCLPGIRCFDRLKTLWRPEQHRRETKISSPLPLSTNESDQYYDSSDHEPLRHAVGPMSNSRYRQRHHILSLQATLATSSTKIVI